MVGLWIFFLLIFAFTLTNLVFGPGPVREEKDYMIEIATIEQRRIVPTPIYSRPSRSKPVVKEVIKPVVRPAKVVVKPAPKPVVKPVVIPQHPLYDDCVSVLVNLGEKKPVAISNTKKILASNDVKSVEDFIRIAFSR